MKQIDGVLVLTAKEEKIYRLLNEGKSQSEVAEIIQNSRAFVNQITKKLISNGFITEVKHAHRYIKRYQQPSQKLEIIIEEKTRSQNYRCCMYCGKPYYNKNKKQKFCSQYCRARSMEGPNSKNWTGGKQFNPYCWKFNEDLKERVRIFFDRKCFACGAPENGIKHSVHHVHHNRMACCDESPQLMIPLCGSCHATTTHTNNQFFLEQLYHNQLMIRTGGKCFISKLEMLKRVQERNEQKANFITSKTISL